MESEGGKDDDEVTNELSDDEDDGLEANDLCLPLGTPYNFA